MFERSYDLGITFNLFTRLANYNFKNFKLKKSTNPFRKIIYTCFKVNLTFKIVPDFCSYYNLHYNAPPVDSVNDKLVGISAGVLTKSNYSPTPTS